MSDFTEKAMLATLTVRRWKATKLDRAISEDVAEQYQMDRSYGSYSKHLMPRNALQAVAKAARAARDFHAAETLPWFADGTRILPAKNYLRYAGEMRRLKAEFERAAAEFAQAYPALREEARTALGNAWRAEDYPTPEQIAASFGMDVNIAPLPSAKDFRVSLNNEEAAAIKAQIEARTQAAVADAARDLWLRAEEAVSRLRDRAAALDGEDVAVLRGAVMETVRAVAGMLDRLNMTDDPALDALRSQIERELLTVPVEEIRLDPHVRAQVRTRADTILAAMAGYTGGTH
jgi:hypothetical protein